MIYACTAWNARTVVGALGGFVLLLVLGCAAGERERRPVIPLAERMEVLAGQMDAPQGKGEPPPLPTTCPGKRPDGADTRCAPGVWQIIYDCVQGLPCGGGSIKLTVVLGKDGHIMASGGLERPVYGIGLWYSDPDFPDEGSALVVNLYGSQQDASEGKPRKCIGQFWSKPTKKGPADHLEGSMFGMTPDRKPIMQPAVAEQVPVS